MQKHTRVATIKNTLRLLIFKADNHRTSPSIITALQV